MYDLEFVSYLLSQPLDSDESLLVDGCRVNLGFRILVSIADSDEDKSDVLTALFR